MYAIMFLSAIGFLIALYAFYVERKVRANHLYKPACDIAEGMSCTKPILSKYGKMLGVSNALLGMIFYAVVFIAALLGFEQIVLILSWLAVIASVVMAYILYVKIKTVCILCTAVYVINALLLVASYWYL